jgi:non-haem dioxygenase in morphine synthesis N-terminal
MHSAMLLLFTSWLLIAASVVRGEEVPIIDLHKPEHEIVQAIGQAAAEWGFFQIINHR